MPTFPVIDYEKKVIQQLCAKQYERKVIQHLCAKQYVAWK